MMPVSPECQKPIYDPYGSQEFGVFHKIPRFELLTSSLESNSPGIPLCNPILPWKNKPSQFSVPEARL